MRVVDILKILELIYSENVGKLGTFVVLVVPGGPFCRDSQD